MIPNTTSPSTFETLAATDAMTGSAVLAALRALFSGIALVAALFSATVGLYLVKSALGINLLPWNSPLHDFFYHLVR